MSRAEGRVPMGSFAVVTPHSTLVSARLDGSLSKSPFRVGPGRRSPAEYFIEIESATDLCADSNNRLPHLDRHREWTEPAQFRKEAGLNLIKDRTVSLEKVHAEGVERHVRQAILRYIRAISPFQSCRHIALNVGMHAGDNAVLNTSLPRGERPNVRACGGSEMGEPKCADSAEVAVLEIIQRIRIHVVKDGNEVEQESGILQSIGPQDLKIDRKSVV